MAYSGKYKLTRPEKYIGNPNKIRYLSLWEKQVMKFLENCVNVVHWSSEVPIEYVCRTDGQIHKYLVDFYIELDDGKRLMVEVKPHKQTQEPKMGTRKTRKYMNECFIYAKNISKWDAARALCKDTGMEFQIWTEYYLKNELGLKII